jgi:UDP-3-O-acyl-N-acetylglucosamine deacetylase
LENSGTDSELLKWASGQNYLSRRQRTIANNVSFSGKSIIGEGVRITLRPAPPNTGLVFRRTDLKHRPEIPVSLANICRSSMYIALTRSGWREGLLRKLLRGKAHLTPFRYMEHLLLPLPEPHMAVVEHFLAVAYLLVDNLIVEVNGDDLPYTDFDEYARWFKEASIEEQEADRRLFTVDGPYRIEGKHGQVIEIRPGDELFIDYSVDFTRKSSAVGKQRHTMVLTPETFIGDISRARTLFLVKWRRLVTDIYKGVDYSSNSLNKILAADTNEYLNKGPDAPRYVENGCSTEVARHKVGDLLGEMALTGIPLLGRIRIHRGGHDFTIKAFKNIIESGFLREL